MICEKCSKEIKDGIPFCGYCGAKVNITTKLLCANCGFDMEADSQFCPKCGTPKNKNEHQQISKSVSAPQPIVQPQLTPQPAQQQIQTPVYKKQKSRKAPLFILFLIIIVGLGFYANSVDLINFNDILSKVGFKSIDGIQSAEEAYGDYYGASSVRIDYDNSEFDEAMQNPFVDIDLSYIYIDESIFLYEFWDYNDIDISIYSEYDVFDINVRKSKVSIKDNYTLDGQIFELNLEANIFYNDMGEKMIEGVLTIHVEDELDKDMWVDYIIDFTATAPVG